MGVAIMGDNTLVANLFDAAGSSLLRLTILALQVLLGLVVYLTGLHALNVVRLRELIAGIR